MSITSFTRRFENMLVGVRSGRGRASAKRRLSAAVEAVESRVMLSVTSTTPVPVTVIEGSPFSGEVMDFTSNDAGPFNASINWGDGTPVGPGVVSAKAGGGFKIDS